MLKARRPRRTLDTSKALERLFGNRKHKPCAYCGKRLTLQTATFDHVKAFSQGGYDKTKNGAIACRPCNRRKGAMTREQFLKLPARRTLPVGDTERERVAPNNKQPPKGGAAVSRIQPSRQDRRSTG